MAMAMFLEVESRVVESAFLDRSLGLGNIRAFAELSHENVQTGRETRDQKYRQNGSLFRDGRWHLGPEGEVEGILSSSVEGSKRVK